MKAKNKLIALGLVVGLGAFGIVLPEPVVLAVVEAVGAAS